MKPKGRARKPDDEKMEPETIRLMKKTRREARELAKFDGQKIGEWLRECVELRVEARK